ncbi:unnamed protein product [Cuscuta campestris]|uniref:HAT C-terminal dimerisation domain-containing protein n=1 Tax=Cuscuta campestris TaxID=132261 RepID=A0A484LP13_9ASTE|nr:unnamed protein product [Cuscuta campestris]
MSSSHSKRPHLSSTGENVDTNIQMTSEDNATEPLNEDAQMTSEPSRTSKQVVRKFKPRSGCWKHFKETKENGSRVADTPTIWNSTYKMLNVAQKYENAFQKYAKIDPYFVIDFSKDKVDKVDRPPNAKDWVQAKHLMMLQNLEDIDEVIDVQDIEIGLESEEDEVMVRNFKEMANPSESAFSTGGRHLDAFRTSLTPKMVQALICSQDWLKTSKKIDMEETLDELKSVEKDMANLSVHDCVVDTVDVLRL